MSDKKDKPKDLAKLHEAATSRTLVDRARNPRPRRVRPEPVASPKSSEQQNAEAGTTPPRPSDETVATTGQADDAASNQETVPKKPSGVTVKRADGTQLKIGGDNAGATGRLPMSFTSPPRPSTTASKKSAICPKCGIYHCHVCDKCISGMEPYKQHNKSEKHLKKVREQELLLQAKSGDGAKSEAAKKQPWLKYVDASCDFPGCSHHCTLCDLHITGSSPARQHYMSREHIAMETSMANVMVTNDNDSAVINSQEPIASEMNISESVTSSIPNVAVENGLELSPRRREDIPVSAYSDSTNARDEVKMEIARDSSPLGNVKQHTPPSSRGDSSSHFEVERLNLDSLKLSDDDEYYDADDEPKPFPMKTGELIRKLMAEGADMAAAPVDSKKKAYVRVPQARQQPTEDLSILDDGNYVYDISQEPDIPTPVARRPQKTGDDGWREGPVELTPEELQRLAEENEKKRLEFDETEKQWEKHWEEMGGKPKNPTKRNQLMVSSRLEAINIIENKPVESSGLEMSENIGGVEGSNSPREDNAIHTSCTHPGCFYHCDLCDAHLSGDGPRRQHESSTRHLKIQENAQRLKRNDRCDFPGCCYHCIVCDSHLSGVLPRDQHLLSAKHIQKAKARGLAVSDASPRRPGQSPSGSADSSPRRPEDQDSPNMNTGTQQALIVQTSPLTNNPFPTVSPPSGAPASCGLPFCYHHCYPCNIHLSGPEPRDQHLQSGKHIQKEQRYVQMKSQRSAAASSSPQIQEAATDVDVDGYDAFIDCPVNFTNCYFHCKVCDKHFAGAKPKIQHEQSDKHLKAVVKFLRGKTHEPDTLDGIVESASGIVANPEAATKKNEFVMPDRTDLPLVKAGPENDLDHKFNTTSEPREYQKEIFQKARDADAICFMPTGTGKTLVSAMLIDFMLQKNPWRPVLFIVDKVLLVLQQTRYLREEIGDQLYNRYGVIRRLNVAGLCGGKTDLRGALSEHVDVLVATAGLVENLIQQKSIRWGDFCMVALDEIHHCIKDHPYKRLITKNHEGLDYDSRPKLFGMSASPAAEMNFDASLARLRNLLRSVGHAKLCKVENCLLELDEYQSKTKIEYVYVALSETERELQASLQRHLLMCYRFLTEHSDIAKLEIGIKIDKNRPDIHNQFEFAGEKLINLRDNLDLVTARQGDDFRVKNTIQHTYTMCSALMGLNICGDIAAYNVLQELTGESAFSFKSMRGFGIQNEALHKSVQANCKDISVKGYVMTAIEKGQNMSAYDKLMNLIMNRVDWDSRARGKQPIVLILVQERKAAVFLTEILASNDWLKQERIKVTSLVGHGVRGYGDGMTVAKQSRILAGIQEYMYQIIVATSVAEEGLDLPSCDVVVEMDPPGGITSLVQIRGRARQKESSLYCICRTDWQETYIRRLVLNERNMYRAIDQVCSEQEFDEFGNRD